jgi:hypothetical protein
MQRVFIQQRRNHTRLVKNIIIIKLLGADVKNSFSHYDHFPLLCYNKQITNLLEREYAF